MNQAIRAGQLNVVKYLTEHGGIDRESMNKAVVLAKRLDEDQIFEYLTSELEKVR